MRIHSDLRRRGRSEAKSARGTVRQAGKGTDTRRQAREAVTREQLTSSRGGGRIRKEAGGGGATPLIATRISASSQGTRAPSPVPASFRQPPRQLGHVRLFPPVSLKPFGDFRNSSARDPRACSQRGVVQFRGPFVCFRNSTAGFPSVSLSRSPKSPSSTASLQYCHSELGTGWVLNKHCFMNELVSA